jgi:hypothetical protein
VIQLAGPAAGDDADDRGAGDRVVKPKLHDPADANADSDLGKR